jgi:N-acetylmuramic acid 6-phosphate etherase
MNSEDKKVPDAIAESINSIESLIEAIYLKLEAGGRLFYIGAGTSGRLGVLDASECPPTFGVADKVIGIIAGGEKALMHAVEGAEDDMEAGWNDLLNYEITTNDFVLGISASGTTQYVIGAIQHCNAQGILTGSFTCNKNSLLSQLAKFPVEVVVGPEFVTGSTRMKAGTAEKLVLNMISTAVMVRLGRVHGNKMVDMQLLNQKLIGRGVCIIQESLKISSEEARALLIQYGSVRKVLDLYK